MFYFQIDALVSSPVARNRSVSPSVHGLSYACFLSSVFCSLFIALFFSCFSSLSLDLATPLGLSGYVDGVFSFSYGLVGVSSVGINVMICSNRFSHDNLLRRVQDLEEIKDLAVSLGDGCFVIRECFLRRVFCFPNRENVFLNLVILLVTLLVWFVGVLLYVFYEDGDDLLQNMYYPNFDMYLSGRWKSSEDFSDEFIVSTPWKMWINFGLLAAPFLEEGFLSSIKKKIYRVVNHVSSIQAHPHRRGMLLLLLLFYVLVIGTRFWLRDSGYEIPVLFKNRIASGPVCSCLGYLM